MGFVEKLQGSTKSGFGAKAVSPLQKQHFLFVTAIILGAGKDDFETWFRRQLLKEQMSGSTEEVIPPCLLGWQNLAENSI